MADVKLRIRKLVKRAEALIPDEPVADLPPMKSIPDVPKWHGFENSIWTIGETIRGLLADHTSLRKDHELQDLYVSIATNRNAKRGRQSFFFLLKFKACARCAPAVASQLDDSDVKGHALSALRKMRAGGYADQARAILDDPNTWIRNEAKKYISRFPA